MRHELARHLVMSLAVLLLALATARADGPQVVRDQWAKLLARHAARLESLAATCEKTGDTGAARRLREFLPRRQSATIYLFKVEQSLDEGNSAWEKEFAAARRQQAEDLFALAQQAAEKLQPGLSCELLLDVLHENPDHADARKLMGYVEAGGAWRRPYDVRQEESGKTWHERFGWLPKDHASRYERGERFYRNRWMTAEEESGMRGSIERAWRVETEHFAIATNHSLEEGAALAERLESLHSDWKSLFPGYLTKPADFARRFERRLPRQDAVRRHNVVYYRSRDEYNTALLPSQPRIEMTLGIYFDKARTAYFFAGDGQDSGTLNHEATHQLFQEAKPTKPDLQRRGNFWVVEAIACYMESLHEHATYVTLGGFDAGRVPAARQRLEEGFYVPMVELVTFGVEDFQRHANLPKLYSQSAGLAMFFLHAEEGLLRESFTAYLDAVYSGRASAETLAKLCGASYDDLDRRYRAFLTPAHK